MEGGKQPTAAPWVIASQAGSALVGPVILGVVLDLQFDWLPWATLIGIGIGLAGSLMLLLTAANQSR